MTDGGFPGAPPGYYQDPVDAEIKQVWDQTRVVPVSTWESRANTGYVPAEPDATGPQRLHHDLSGMHDSRSVAGFEERQGSVERRYADDDL
jgi:hypothetical protein